MRAGPLYPKILNCDKRILVLQGGGDSGKTTTALQVLATFCTQIANLVVTVEGEDIPNLKAGALRTFQRYVLPDPGIKDNIIAFNKTDRVYTFFNNSIMEFKSFADEQDARGSERDYLYMNEANSRSYKMFWQLQRKTRKQVIIDYNPTMRFWCHDKLLDEETRIPQFTGKVQLYITDHRHNPFLSKEEHDAYEAIDDPELFNVYARGKTGATSGRIYKFKKIDKIPPKLGYGFGIDLGYNMDKIAIIKVWFNKRKRYYKEILYKSENEILDIIVKEKLDCTVYEYVAKVLRDNGCTSSTLVWGDHDKTWANSLRRLRIPYRMARKGPNSVRAGISKVKSFENFYIETKNFKDELQKYVWEMAVDQLTGKEVMLTTPLPGTPDHLLDALRYFVHAHSLRYSYNGEEKEVEEDDYDEYQEAA